MGDAAHGGGGFQGSVSSLSLVDVVQLQSANRFSGIISISSGQRTGRLFFDDGNVVHAETSGLAGEPAVHHMLGWAGGHFHLHPRVMAMTRTITKQVSHLLLDATQALDEGRQPVVPPPRPPPPEVPTSSPSGTMRARINSVSAVKGLQGVASVVRFGRDGAPIGDGDPQADRLASRGQHLASVCHAIGHALGLKDPTSASVRTRQEPFLLFQANGNTLCVGVGPGARNEEVEARVRAALARKGGPTP